MKRQTQLRSRREPIWFKRKFTTSRSPNSMPIQETGVELASAQRIGRSRWFLRNEVRCHGRQHRLPVELGGPILVACGPADLVDNIPGMASPELFLPLVLDFVD